MGGKANRPEHRIWNNAIAGKVQLMRKIATLLMILAVGFGLGGQFFGRASWMGMSSHSIPIWLLLEALALAMLIISFAIRVRATR